MFKLLTLFFALIVPLSARPQRRFFSFTTRGHPGDKPRADRLAELAWTKVESAAAAAFAWMADCFDAMRGLAASVADPRCPAVTLEPGLAIAVGASAPLPPALTKGSTLVRRITQRSEALFAQRWEDPQLARMASQLFVGSLALSCAGIVGAVTVTAPPPAVHLQRLASVVTGDSTAGRAQLATAGMGGATGGDQKAPAPTPIDGGSAPTLAPAPVAAPVVPIPPAQRGGLPIGKGMWIWMEDRADGGDPNAIVARAKAVGLTHLYVRTGTLKGGFIGGPFLDRLLPVAHAKGIRVYGWDFPYLNRPGDDVNRALAAIRHTTPDGHRIDGFSADIESSHEGTNNEVEYVNAYVTWLRDNVGPDYPLIATVPNPTPIKVASGFPYATIIPAFDAVAPMVYWMNRDPGTDVANAIAYLSQFGKPIFPVGQAYDGGPEGGPVGAPGREAMIRFLQSADASGASGASFWSYQHATPEAWDAIRDSGEFRLELGGAVGLTPGMIRSYQTVLSGLGFVVAADGLWGPATIDAVKRYQAAAKLPVTGTIDKATRTFLLTPVAAPIAKH